MPYEGEHASYHLISRIANSEVVQDFLRNQCDISEAEYIRESAFNDLNVQVPPTSSWMPKYIIAIDGSNMPVPVRNGYPGAELCYISVASVLLDMDLLKELDTQRFGDPALYEKTRRVDPEVDVLPGANVVMRGEGSSLNSFRRKLFEIIQSWQIEDGSESLLETYESLLKYKTSHKEQCPYDDCDFTLSQGTGVYKCSCNRSRTVYSTDALRIHEGFNPSGSSGAAFTEVMQVLERIWLIHILRSLEKKNLLRSLKRVAIIIDGPLAVFGHPAWLKDAIMKEIRRINTVFKQLTGNDLLILGIEKTGPFMEHLAMLDVNPDGSPNRIAPGTVMLITDQYIKRNIIRSDSERVYGQQTYFGRKFFYKTRSGALIVGMTPFLTDYHSDLTTANLDQYPRLVDGLGLLDKLISSRHPNAVVPIVEAHAEAAIPRREGIRILEELSRSLLDGGKENGEETSSNSTS